MSVFSKSVHNRGNLRAVSRLICSFFLIFVIHRITKDQKKRLFHSHFPVCTSVQVDERVTQRLKTEGLRILVNYNKIHEIIGFDGKYSANHPKANF